MHRITYFRKVQGEQWQSPKKKLKKKQHMILILIKWMLSIGPFKDPKITGPSVKETLARELYRIGFPFSLKVPMADCHNLSSPGALLALVTMSCLKLERCKLGLEGNLTPETRKHSDLQNTSCWAHGIHGYHLIRPILQNTYTKSKV